MIVSQQGAPLHSRMSTSAKIIRALLAAMMQGGEWWWASGGGECECGRGWVVGKRGAWLLTKSSIPDAEATCVACTT
jgi:hypothetical protein